MTLTRREYLQLIAAGATGLLGAPLSAAGSPALKRSIPSTGEAMPVIGLGTYQSFNKDSGAQEREGVREVLRLFIEHGGRMIDSSPMYGRSEEVVGDLAAELNVHDALFVATKVWTDGRESGIRQMEQSEQRLQTDRIDLMQVHNLVDVHTQLATLKRWKEEQRIRYLGITHYHSGAYADLEQLMLSEPLDFVQLNYNVVAREAEQRLLPLAADKGIAIIVNRPFQKAALFRKTRGMELPGWAAEVDCATWAQFFLKFVVSHPAVTCAIPATSKPKHLIDNMQAGTGAMPDRIMREKMAGFMRNL